MLLTITIQPNANRAPVARLYGNAIHLKGASIRDNTLPEEAAYAAAMCDVLTKMGLTPPSAPCLSIPSVLDYLSALGWTIHIANTDHHVYTFEPC